MVRILSLKILHAKIDSLHKTNISLFIIFFFWIQYLGGGGEGRGGEGGGGEFEP